MSKRICRRPWGFWIVLLDRRHFKVKLLRFKRGGRLSVQYHHHRSELWLFLNGLGRFNREGIKSGQWRLAQRNRKHTFRAIKPTWVLEIQYGEICSEEDIVRV